MTISRRSAASSILAIAALSLPLVLQPAISTPVGVAVPVEPTAAIVKAVRDALGQGSWVGMDGHVHTDHSHDSGFFHQQTKRPENHDTFVRDQIDEAERVGEDFVTLTDHRTYDQAYDPEYTTSGATLIEGEEWGGPHSTAWGITETLNSGVDNGDCGLVLAAREVRAQDGIFGVAHPEDGRQACVSTANIGNAPIDHLEAFRFPHTNFYNANIAAGNRIVPVTGSDNHFKQLHGSEGGVGGNSTLFFVNAPTQAAMVDAVREGRVTSVSRMIGPTLSTLLDADNNGTFEAMTGGWGTPTGATVRVAFEARNAVGLWLQILDHSTMIEQRQVTLPNETIVFDLPAGRQFWRGQLDASPAGRVTGQVANDYLSYADSLRLLSAPVWLSAPTTRDPGSASLLTDANFAGFPDAVASNSGNLVVAQERAGDTYRVRLINHDSDLDGRIISADTEDAREPAIAAEGDTVAVAYVDRARTTLGGKVIVQVSTDGGLTFAEPVVANKGMGPGLNPDIAISNGDVHVVWSSMEDQLVIRHATLGGASTRLSSATIRPIGTTAYSPATTALHVPAAVTPSIAVDGDNIVVAWSDNREDATPLRNGTPDDWGIYVASSSNGGATFSADSRVSPRHDQAAPNAADPEKHIGNPAKHPSIAFLSGQVVLAWSDATGSNGGSRIRTRQSADAGLTWSTVNEIQTASNQMAVRPHVAQLSGIASVVWQQSAGREWQLRSANAFSTDAGDVVAQGPFAGFPTSAGTSVYFTASGAERYGIAFVAL